MEALYIAVVVRKALTWTRLYRPGKKLYVSFVVLKEYRTLFPFVRKYFWSYLIGLVFLLVTNFGQIYIPQIIRQAVDLLSGGAVDLGRVFQLMAFMVLLALSIAVGRFGWRVFILGAGRKIEKELRDKLFSHLLTLSSGFYGRMKTGDIMARATNDMANVREAAGFSLVSFVDGFLMTVAILVIMFSQHPRIALLTVIPAPVVTVLVLGVGRVLGERFRRVQEGFSGLSEHVQEALSGIRVLKSFVREEYSRSQFEDRNDEYRRRNMGLVRIWGLFFPVITFLSGLTSLLLLRFGGTAVIEGAMSPGEFVAFLSYLEMLIWPMLGAGYTINLIQRGAASLGRINAILSEVPDVLSPPEGRTSVESPSVSVRNLSYRYPETDELALDSVSIDVPAGSTLGILGRTGSGKSTIIRLIPRLLDPPPGTIFVGGVDVHEYDLRTLRAAIGMVPQDTFLFSTSIRENIAFGRGDVGEEEILAAAELSTISRDLKEFPRGMETLVGERGITLSGGQKQRVAISRAVLVDPPILVFDDALSAVDTETEEQILGEFLERRKGKTNILISHRVSTLQNADLIVVLEEGKVTQSGRHGELAARPGLYKEIYELQLSEKTGERS